MARTARRQDAQSIDSLLDTMANVVGILVVLVAVTQLSLGDAVERIRASAGERAAATPDDFAELVGQRERVQNEIDMARSTLERFRGEPRTGMLLEDATPLLDELESLSGPSAAAGDVPSRAEVENMKIEFARLEGDVARAEGEHAQLVAILAEPAVTPELRTIRLPDPRPVPGGLDRRFFFCRGGEVHVVDLAALGDVLTEGIRAATGEYQERPVLRPTDFAWIINHFDKERIGDQGYRWRFDDEFLAVLEPTSAVAPGETPAELRAAGSRTAAALEALNPRRQYVRFFVWPDSYDAYLDARRMAEDRGLRVGWQQMDRDQPLRFRVFDDGRPSRNLLD